MPINFFSQPCYSSLKNDVNNHNIDYYMAMPLLKKLQKLSQRVNSMHFSLRWLLGLSLIIGGILWILPVLGLWMLPLGLLILAPDFPWARRGYLNIVVALRKIRDKKNKPKE